MPTEHSYAYIHALTFMNIKRARCSHTPDPIEVMRKRYNVTILSEEPYLIQFDNFLSDKECEALQEPVTTQPLRFFCLTPGH